MDVQKLHESNAEGIKLISNAVQSAALEVATESIKEMQAELDVDVVLINGIDWEAKAADWIRIRPIAVINDPCELKEWAKEIILKCVELND